MDIAYGHRVEEANDPFISLAEKVVSLGSEAAVPGAFLVDLFPILKNVPIWFPGAGFQKKAERWRKLNNDLTVNTFRDVQEQVVSELYIYILYD